MIQFQCRYENLTVINISACLNYRPIDKFRSPRHIQKVNRSSTEGRTVLLCTRMAFKALAFLSKVKIKPSVFLTEYHAMKTYGSWRYSSVHS